MTAAFVFPGRGSQAPGMLSDLPQVHAAGALEFGEAITAVTHRARRMAELFPHGYGLLAISGLGEAEVRAIAEQVTEEGGGTA